eukprot:s121_g19.t1
MQPCQSKVSSRRAIVQNAGRAKQQRLSQSRCYCTLHYLFTCRTEPQASRCKPIGAMASGQRLLPGCGASELVLLRRLHRELSAVRISRWWRGTLGRRRLPAQLRKARVLRCSCERIQKAWRSRRKVPPKAPEPETRKAEKDSERSAIDALPAEYAVYEGAEPRSRAAALWQGCKLRRALATRAVQAKLQLRRDLYWLIVDVESRHPPKVQMQDPHVGPWLDVLYAGLSKLQSEALAELAAALHGRRLPLGRTMQACR